MLVSIKQSYFEVSQAAARFVAAAVRKKPQVTLGLATGGTPLGMYRELIRLHREEGLDFSQVVTFNLDEYVGLPADHPQSYHVFMQSQFFNHVNIDPRNIHIPDGTVQTDVERYCAAYEEQIRKAGGIDLQILGIGTTGHIGFNEASSSLSSRTRVTALAEQTIDDNRRFFPPGEKVPQCAITMGLGTILDARKILLLASGPHKARAVASAIEGPLTASVTASVLQLHPDVTVLLDREAAEQLVNKAYYARAVLLAARHMPDAWG
jgi:glucosamine-6-phosphate deaminase